MCTLAAVTMCACAAPAPEPDLSPFINVWTPDPPPEPGAPMEYLILQGDFSVCRLTVRGPTDATYSGGEYTLTPKQLTLTFKRDRASWSQTYAINAYGPGELNLTEAAPGEAGRPIKLRPTKAYFSCADAQTLFGKLLKIR